MLSSAFAASHCEKKLFSLFLVSSVSARWIARFSSAAAVGGGGGSLPRVLGLDLVDARRQLEPEPGERVAALDRAHVVAIEPVSSACIELVGRGLERGFLLNFLVPFFYNFFLYW